MRERNKENLQSSHSSFLEKFAGKINFLTKDGQIKDQHSFKLPTINSPHSNRASTIKFRTSKDSVHTFFSDARTEISLSQMISKSRGDRFLKSTKIERNITQISNQITKNPSSYAQKKLQKKNLLKEELKGISFNKKEKAQRSQENEKHQSVYGIQKTTNSSVRNYDYQKFLGELNSVSNVVKNNNRRSHIELINQCQRKYQK